MASLLTVVGADLDVKPGRAGMPTKTMRALTNAAVADERTLLSPSPLRTKGAAREARVTSKISLTARRIAALARARCRSHIVRWSFCWPDTRVCGSMRLTLTRASSSSADGGMSVQVEASLHRQAPGSGRRSSHRRTVALMARSRYHDACTSVSPRRPGSWSIPQRRGGGSGYARMRRRGLAAQARAGIEIPSGQTGGWRPPPLLSHRYGQAGATTHFLMTGLRWSDEHGCPLSTLGQGLRAGDDRAHGGPAQPARHQGLIILEPK